MTNLFYYIVLPCNVASDLRVRTTRCPLKWSQSSEKKNTSRVTLLLDNVPGRTVRADIRLNIRNITDVHVESSVQPRIIRHGHP